MRHYYRCGPRFGPKTYAFKFNIPPMFFHGGFHGGLDIDLELDDKDSAEKFLKRNKKWLVTKKEGIESHLKKLNKALEKVDKISAELAQDENYDSKEFQKKLIKEYKKLLVDFIDEEDL